MIGDIEKFIAVVSNDMVVKSDAIILLEGDGYNRLETAADYYNSGYADVVVFTGGIENLSYGSYPAEYILPELLKRGIPKKNILIDSISLNTRDQAVNIFRIAKDKGWKKLILVGSPDHQFRAYLTFLKPILDENSDIVIINAPAKNLPWFKEEIWGSQFNRLEQEFDRIEKYSRSGHLVSIEDALNYQIWKEQQLKKQN